MTKLLFLLELCSRNSGLQGSTLPGHCMTQVSVPLKSRPVAYYREGRTTPHLKLVFM